MKKDLSDKKCLPCEGQISPLSRDKIESLLMKLKNWDLLKQGTAISKEFHFKNFFQTMNFVNAVAWIANSQNHHPDLQVSYNRCTVLFTTHALGGLSENDFICAAKIDALF